MYNFLPDHLLFYSRQLVCMICKQQARFSGLCKKKKRKTCADLELPLVLCGCAHFYYLTLANPSAVHFVKHNTLKNRHFFFFLFCCMNVCRSLLGDVSAENRVQRKKKVSVGKIYCCVKVGPF